MICLTLPGPRIEDNCLYVEMYRQYIDCAELRVDYLLEQHSVEKIAHHAKMLQLPLILTCRTEADGGRFTGTESLQKSILLQLLQSNAFTYVDLECSSDFSDLDEVITATGVTKIISRHDFSGVPIELQEWMHRVAQSGAVPKAAVMPQSTQDLAELYAIGQSLNFPAILLGMGAYGFPSRVLYRRFNSMLTFCSPAGKEAAPGHVTPKYMHDAQVRSLKHTTSKDNPSTFAIIGDPVLHSKSPELHNGWFQDSSSYAGYIHFPMDTLEFGIPLLEQLGITGCSVTMPHKQAIIPYLQETVSRVEQIGSCNTLIYTAKGWLGDNTDYLGIQQPFKTRGIELKGRKVVILGAGGAARAAAMALHDLGAHIVVVNRTRSRAQALVEELEFGEVAPTVEVDGVDVIVQATSVGMDGHGNPLPKYPWKRGMILFESIYAPKEPPIIQEAHACGVEIVYGMEMLTAQGVEQNRLFREALCALSSSSV